MKICNIVSALSLVISIAAFAVASNNMTEAQAIEMENRNLKSSISEFENPISRVMTGNYYDWCVVTTVDGNDWMVDENLCKSLENGDLVQVCFDTNGTEDLHDDIPVSIRRI